MYVLAILAVWTTIACALAVPVGRMVALRATSR
jgi:hypothetical protein